MLVLVTAKMHIPQPFDIPTFMESKAVEKFKAYFGQMNLADDKALDEIYADRVVFTDPIHSIQGLDNLKAYFKKLNSNLISGTFQFTDESIVGHSAYLQWEMHLSLNRPRKQVKASGISVLTFGKKLPPSGTILMQVNCSTNTSLYWEV